MKRKTVTFFTLSILVVAASPTFAQRTKVESLRPLLLEAISKGEAHGQWEGPWLEYLADRFKTREPLLIDVRALSSLKQEGCKLLEVVAKQDGIVEEPGKQPTTGTVTYHVRYCSNGMFPDEDQEKLDELLEDADDD